MCRSTPVAALWTGLVALLLVVAHLPALGETPVRIVRGIAGLAAVPFAARNDAPQPIDCVAALAHWYSLDLGRAEPGGHVEATLWSDVQTGELFLLNASKDRMAVQAIVCGQNGSAWTSGSRIVLDRRIGRVPDPVLVACRPGPAGAVECR